MPMIRVEMMPGRTADQKRDLAKALTEAFVTTAGGKPESVHVVLTEVEPDAWAVGGEFMSDRAPSK